MNNENKLLDDFLNEIKKVGAAKVARLSGFSATIIYDWIHKRKTPTLLNAQKVANAMGLEFLIFDQL